MELSLITDEVSQDPHEAAEFAVEHHVRQVAVRSVWGRNIMQCTEDEIERLVKVFNDHGLVVSSVLSPLFKCPTEAVVHDDLADPHFVGFPPSYETHVSEAKRLPAIAERLGAPTIRIFTFLTDDPSPGAPPTASTEVIVNTAARWTGVKAGVENEYVCYVKTLPELEAFCVATGLAAIIDPCNQDVAVGEDGLTDLSDDLIALTIDVHVKDRIHGTYVPVGTGALRWPLILQRLAQFGYAGPITLESHLRGDRDGIAASIRTLREWGVA